MSIVSVFDFDSMLKIGIADKKILVDLIHFRPMIWSQFCKINDSQVRRQCKTDRVVCCQLFWIATSLLIAAIVLALNTFIVDVDFIRLA